MTTLILHFPDLESWVTLEDTYKSKIISWHVLGVAQGHLGSSCAPELGIVCPMVIVKGLGNHKLSGFRGSRPTVKPPGLHSGIVIDITGVPRYGRGRDWDEDSLNEVLVFFCFSQYIVESWLCTRPVLDTGAPWRPLKIQNHWGQGFRNLEMLEMRPCFVP